MLKKSSFVGAARLGNIAGVALLMMVVARNSSLTEFGRVTVAYSTISVVSVILRFGFPNLVVRGWVDIGPERNPSQRGEIFIWAIIVSIGLSVPVYLAWNIANTLLSTDFQSQRELLLGLGAAWLMCVIALNASMLRASGNAISAATFEFLAVPVGTLCLALALKKYVQLDLSSVLIMRTSISLLVACVSGCLIAPSANASKQTPNWAPFPVVGAALPLALLTTSQTVNKNLDVIMLSSLGSVEQAGIYGMAAKVSLLPIVFSQALNYIVASQISDAWRNDLKEQVARLSMRAAKLGVLASLLSVATLLAFGPWAIPRILGPEFVGIFTICVALFMGQLVNAAFGPVIVILNMTGNARWSFWCVLASTFSNILLNLMLIPVMGAWGCVVASVTTIILWNALAAYGVRQKVGIKGGLL